MDIKAMQQAIIRELYRQHVEVAEVLVWRNATDMYESSIEILDPALLTASSLEKCRVENQVPVPFPVPEGLEHIRELDLEIHELIEAGLIERKDCGYALTQQ